MSNICKPPCPRHVRKASVCMARVPCLTSAALPRRSTAPTTATSVSNTRSSHVSDCVHTILFAAISVTRQARAHAYARSHAHTTHTHTHTPHTHTHTHTQVLGYPTLIFFRKGRQITYQGQRVSHETQRASTAVCARACSRTRKRMRTFSLSAAAAGLVTDRTCVGTDIGGAQGIRRCSNRGMTGHVMHDGVSRKPLKRGCSKSLVQAPQGSIRWRQNATPMSATECHTNVSLGSWNEAS